MLYLSEYEEKLGGLDSLDMVSVFDIDKYDFNTEFSDIKDVIRPFISTLSPIDLILYNMYYVNRAEINYVASYFNLSTTAIYKRIRAMKGKLKLIIYLNMSKMDIFNLLNCFIFHDSSDSNFISQYVYHRTSSVGSETIDFKAMMDLVKVLQDIANDSPDNISLYTKRVIKRNSKRNKTHYKVKKLNNVIQFLISSKAYRYNIFRGELKRDYCYLEQKGQRDSND